MALIDHKITDTDIQTKGVQSAPDKLTGTAAQNKLRFDKFITEVLKGRLNGLIDELVTALSGKMAAPDTEGTDGQYLQTDGQGGRRWATPSGAGDMLKSTYDADDDGIVDMAAECLGGAATASKWATARTFAIASSDGTGAGSGVNVDGSGGVTLKLPATIKAALTGNVTGNVSGNASTASKWATARAIKIASSDGTGAGSGVNVDGSGSVTLKLPATIKAALTGNVTGNVSGNASTASKWAAARNVQIASSDGTGAGTEVSMDGSGNVILRLPATIKAALTGNASTASKWATARTFAIASSDGTGAGGTASVDGSSAVTLKLPATIKAALTGNVTGNVTGNCSGSSGSCTGNAATATTWKSSRNFTVKDNSETHSGGAVSVNGSSAVTLKLPATIKARLELPSNRIVTTLPDASTLEEGEIIFKVVT